MFSRFLSFAEGLPPLVGTNGAYASAQLEQHEITTDDPTNVLFEIDIRGKPGISVYGVADALNPQNVSIALDVQIAGGPWYPVLNFNITPGNNFTQDRIKVAHRARLRAWADQTGGSSTADLAIAAGHI